MVSDEVILSHLRADSRRSLSAISYSEKIPISTVFDRISKLESKIILRYYSLINPAYLRFSIHAFFHVSDSTKNILNLSTVNINSILELDRKNTYFIEAFFRSSRDFAEFKSALKTNKIQILKQFLVFETITREKLLSKA
jgi:DNA-binding Lrp family transcriptional regulator